ncbi:MAG: amidohydrolase family protein [Eubacterium sp.]|nr:amidohydrolase family protein [Eubacterium sp.]
MIIDFHTHTYPDKIVKHAIQKLERNSGWKAVSDGTKAGLQKAMQQSGVDLSVLLPVATSKRQVDTINDEAARTNETTDQTGLLSFGGIHPETPDIKQTIRTIKNLGLKGIKLHPDYQDAYFNDIRYKRIVDQATEQGLYIVIHAGEDSGLPDPIHCRPEHIREVLRDTGSDRLILAHMGGWRLWDEVEELLIGEDVYFDTATSLEGIPGVTGLLTKEHFAHLVRKKGADRILFGTDSPWQNAADNIQWIEETELLEEEKENIFSKNAKRILGL